MIVCVLVVPLSFLLNDQVVPRTNEVADAIKTQDIKDRGSKRRAIWNTQGRSLYQLQELDLGLGRAEALVYYELDDDGLPTQRIDADLARYETAGRWQLEGVSAAAIGTEDDPRPIPPVEYVDLGESPNEELDLMHLSVEEVASLITDREASGESTTSLEVDFHSKLAAPLACLILPALILAFGVGGATFPSVPTTFIFAGFVAVLHSLSSGAVMSLGRNGELPPMVAGWGTNLLGLVLLASLSRIRAVIARLV